MKSVNNFSVFFQFFFFSVCILSCMKCLLVKKECHLGATWHAFFITLEQKKPLLLWMNSYRSNAGVFTRLEMFQPLTLLWIVYLDLYYIFRWMGRAGSVHTGSLWTQMILNLRTNTMAVLIITATRRAKNTVTLSTQKFLFGAFVPFWDIFRYVCLDKIIHIFQTQMYLCLWMKNIVYFFPFPYLSMKIKHLAWERGRPPWWWKSKLF